MLAFANERPRSRAETTTGFPLPVQALAARNRSIRTDSCWSHRLDLSIIAKIPASIPEPWKSIMTSLFLDHRHWMILSVTLSMTISASPAFSESKRPPSPELPRPISKLDGLVDPLTGEMLSTFNPKQPTTSTSQRKADALAKYMTGRLNVERRRVPAAFKAFEDAIRLDPEAIESYKAVITLLLAQSRVDEAENYTLKAVRNTDDGYELALLMATLFVRQTQVDRGVSILERSIGTRSVKAGSKEELLVHRDLGLFHRLNKDFDKASQEYEFVFKRITTDGVEQAVLDAVLTDPGANFDEFGDTFLKANKPDLALLAYEEASKHREAKPGLHSFNLATVYQQTGQPEQAMKSLQEYFDAKLQSRGRAPYALLETLLKDLKQEGELVSRLEGMLEKDKANDVLRYFLAGKVLEQGEIARAKELYLNGNETVTDPRALVGMLSIYRHQGDYKEILPALTKAFQVIPRSEDEDALNRLAEDVRALSEAFEEELTSLKADEKSMKGLFDYARTIKAGDDPQLEFIQAYLLGKLAIEAGYSDDALEFYKYAISMRNDPPALLFTEVGGHLLDSQKYDQAIEILEAALNSPANSLQSDRWRFLFFLSYGYEFQGNTDKALKTIQEAIAVAPDPIQGRLEYQRAWIYYHARNWDKALEQFNRVITEFADNDDLVQDSQFRISSIYVELGDSAKGESVLEDVLKKDPENTQANNDLGYLWADQGKNLDKAYKMIQKALDAEPENPAYLDSMGWVLFKKGEFDKAVEQLKKATSLKNGDDSTIFDHLGDAFQKIGKISEAIQAYEKALQIEDKKSHANQKVVDAVKQKLQDLKASASPS